MKLVFVAMAITGIFLITHLTDRENSASRYAINSDIEQRIHTKAVCWWLASVIFEVIVIIGVAVS